MSKTAVQQEFAALVDRFGDLDAKVSLFRPVLKEHEVLRKQILAPYENEPANLGFVAKGLRYSVLISYRSMQRKLCTKLVYKLLGLLKFLSVCSVTMEAIKDEVTPEQMASLLIVEQTGHRSIKAVPMVAEVTD